MMSEQTGKIEAGIAAVKVLESWGVKQVYGLPAGSLNSWMDALKTKKIILTLFKYDMKKSVP